MSSNNGLSFLKRYLCVSTFVSPLSSKCGQRFERSRQRWSVLFGNAESIQLIVEASMKVHVHDGKRFLEGFMAIKDRNAEMLKRRCVLPVEVMTMLLPGSCCNACSPRQGDASPGIETSSKNIAVVGKSIPRKPWLTFDLSLLRNTTTRLRKKVVLLARAFCYH